MDTYHVTNSDVSAAGPRDGREWREFDHEVTARLQAITRNVKDVLAQEGLSEIQVDYDKLQETADLYL